MCTSKSIPDGPHRQKQVNASAAANLVDTLVLRLAHDEGFGEDEGTLMMIRLIHPPGELQSTEAEDYR